jgi:hypothetical protein
MQKSNTINSLIYVCLTIAGNHLSVQVLSNADDPGIRIHVELSLPVTVHHRILDTTILTLKKKCPPLLYKKVRKNYCYFFSRLSLFIYDRYR